MEIYRFFHPHYNPRLLMKPLRQQELLELEQAAGELKKAISRARQRLAKAPSPPLLPQHCDEILKALAFVENSLQTLSDAHPGDSPQALAELMEERRELRGWEGWSNLVSEQLAGTERDGVEPFKTRAA